MAYEKNMWETGDVITAGKLNNMEDGIAASSSGDSSLDLHAIKNGAHEPSFSGEEIQAIMDTVPKVVVMIHDNTDDLEWPHYLNYVYRLNRIFEDPDHVVTGCTYACDESGNGDAQSILYIDIALSDDGTEVNYLCTATASGAGRTDYVYTYNSSTENWEDNN